MALLTHTFVYYRLFALGAVLPLLLSCGDGAGEPTTASPAIPVVSQAIATAPWRDSIQALGTTRANESVTLTAKVSETVRRVAFDSGDIVEAGEVLVDLSSGVELAGLEEARADYREAERLLQRQQELAEQKLVAASQIDTQRAARDAARAYGCDTGGAVESGHYRAFRRYPGRAAGQRGFPRHTRHTHRHAR